MIWTEEQFQSVFRTVYPRLLRASQPRCRPRLDIPTAAVVFVT